MSLGARVIQIVSGTMLLAVAGAPAFAQSTSCTVSKSQFLALRSGMTYRQVVGVLGCEGEEMSRTEMMGMSAIVYSWSGSSWSGANLIVEFENGHLVSKAQAGLSD